MKRAAILAGVMLAACGAAPGSHTNMNAESVHTGFLRRGFEHSDFYPERNPVSGPWWTSVEESEINKLLIHARGEGRGRFVTVRVVARGTVGEPVDFGFRPPFEHSLHITEVISATPVDDEIFNAIAARGRNGR